MTAWKGKDDLPRIVDEMIAEARGGSMSLCITVDRQPHGDLTWLPWVEENDLGWCFHLVALDESLTRWRGSFYRVDSAGFRVRVANELETYEAEVTTTPGDPRWLIEMPEALQ